MTLTSGGARSEDRGERENEEFSGKMGHAGGVCRRSPSRERPHAKSLTFDFVAGLHAFDHDGPLWCVLSKDYFVADNLFLYLHDLACQPCCPVYVTFFPSLFSPFLLSLPFFFSRHEDVASWLAGVMSKCPGVRPAWPYLFARTAWCLGLSSFRLSSSLQLSLLCSCAHRWVPVSFPITCACRGKLSRCLVLLLFSSYSFCSCSVVFVL